MSDLVSIIVPCYNQAQYLDEALQSVLDQTYTHWECIIINDGSPDNTETIAKEWVNKDCRFKYFFQKNGGVSSARNLGITTATGEFILPLDADDKISPNYVELAMKAFEYDISLKVVYCKAEKFGNEVGLWNLPPYSIKALALDNMIFCTAMYRKEDWKRIGGYDPGMISGLEDWEFWIGLLKNGEKIYKLDIIGFYYRVKNNSRQTDLNRNNKSSLFEYISVKHADFYVKQLGSFHELSLQWEKQKADFLLKTTSEKFLIDALFYRLFGFTFFGNKFRKN
jgi:glycosyltransferase involved in cell wall biosynthesis